MTEPSRPKLRAGQTVEFRHTEPSGEVLTGKALVLQAGGDGESVKLLPLSLFHLEVPADAVTPVSVSDVLPAALQQPEQPAGDTGNGGS